MREVFGWHVWADEIRKYPVATVVGTVLGGVLTYIANLIGIPDLDNLTPALTGLGYVMLFFLFSFLSIALIRFAFGVPVWQATLTNSASVLKEDIEPSAPNALPPIDLDWSGNSVEDLAKAVHSMAALLKYQPNCERAVFALGEIYRSTRSQIVGYVRSSISQSEAIYLEERPLSIVLHNPRTFNDGHNDLLHDMGNFTQTLRELHRRHLHDLPPNPSPPNLEHWDQKKQFTLWQAAWLFANQEPQPQGPPMTPEAADWFRRLEAGIRDRRLAVIREDLRETIYDAYEQSRGNERKASPKWRTSREDLTLFARTEDAQPPFLFDRERT